MKILVTTRWEEKRLDALRSSFPQAEFVVADTPEEVAKAVVDVDAVLGWLSRDAFLAAKKLRWIQAHSAGVEFLARVPELVESDVIVTNTRGAHAATIAEHAFALLLFLTRGLRHLDAQQRERSWRRPAGVQFVGLSGLTLGVVGLGRIGSAIAKRGHSFDMKVVAVDADDVPRADYVSEFWLLDGLPELLRRSDVVAVAAPITPETRGMLGPDQLALMKPTAYLIVVSRGGIVDEHALVAALREGRLAGAGLDVASQEPLPPDSQLWDAPNLIITPHCSGSSRQTTEMVWSIIAENLSRFIAGQPLMNQVDKRRGY